MKKRRTAKKSCIVFLKNIDFFHIPAYNKSVHTGKAVYTLFWVCNRGVLFRDADAAERKAGAFGKWYADLGQAWSCWFHEGGVMHCAEGIRYGKGTSL